MKFLLIVCRLEVEPIGLQLNHVQFFTWLHTYNDRPITFAINDTLLPSRNQIPAYQVHPFCMFPFSPPSSNSSFTTMRWRYFMLLYPTCVSHLRRTGAPGGMDRSRPFMPYARRV